MTELLDDRAVDDVLARVDGLLLLGGDDLDPATYGEAPHKKVRGVSAARDTTELAITRRALERGVPVLAYLSRPSVAERRPRRFTPAAHSRSARSRRARAARRRRWSARARGRSGARYPTRGRPRHHSAAAHRVITTRPCTTPERRCGSSHAPTTVSSRERSSRMPTDRGWSASSGIPRTPRPSTTTSRDSSTHWCARPRPG